MRKTVLTIAIAAAALIAPAAAIGQRTPRGVAKPPNAPCNWEHRMDVQIINGVWFECSCEALMVGSVCDWYEILSPAADPRSIRRNHKRLIPVMVVKRVVSA